MCTCDSDCGGACQDVLAAVQQEEEEEFWRSESPLLKSQGDDWKLSAEDS